jgi:hypothetical protein
MNDACHWTWVVGGWLWKNSEKPQL